MRSGNIYPDVFLLALHVLALRLTLILTLTHTHTHAQHTHTYLLRNNAFWACLHTPLLNFFDWFINNTLLDACEHLVVVGFKTRVLVVHDTSFSTRLFLMHGDNIYLECFLFTLHALTLILTLTLRHTCTTRTHIMHLCSLTLTLTTLQIAHVQHSS